MFMLEPGTRAVVFDLDGTITVGDGQVVTQFTLDALGASTALNAKLSHKYDLRPRRHALHAVRAWAAKGYQPIYLSGRQGSYYNLTLAWLIKHRYPPGPIHLTRTHLPTLPVYFSVGLFKVKWVWGSGQGGRRGRLFVGPPRVQRIDRVGKHVEVPSARSTRPGGVCSARSGGGCCAAPDGVGLAMRASRPPPSPSFPPCARYIEGLRAKGIDVYAAYGNTMTDIKAYEAAGIAKVGKARGAMPGQTCVSRGYAGESGTASPQPGSSRWNDWPTMCPQHCTVPAPRGRDTHKDTHMRTVLQSLTPAPLHLLLFYACRRGPTSSGPLRGRTARRRLQTGPTTCPRSWHTPTQRSPSPTPNCSSPRCRDMSSKAGQKWGEEGSLRRSRMWCRDVGLGDASSTSSQAQIVGVRHARGRHWLRWQSLPHRKQQDGTPRSTMYCTSNIAFSNPLQEQNGGGQGGQDPRHPRRQLPASAHGERGEDPGRQRAVCTQRHRRVSGAKGTCQSMPDCGRVSRTLLATQCLCSGGCCV